ncbi:CP12 domain-containing protein [Dolichospermum sp. UHCC 0315A]|nr:CP12 domain-containing protein [Dolichospermum sp. UHCC 0315A]
MYCQEFPNALEARIYED